MKIHVGHSPDADDAFMFYALTHEKIETGEYKFEHILRDIETLNRWALEKTLEVTAVSLHAYSHISSNYWLLPHGASIGDQYGPIVVASQDLPVEDLRNKTIAIPGELTTAFLALSLYLGKFSYKVVPFDKIFDAVRNGDADAGLIIHEGQLTYEGLGFRKVLDLGEWWFAKHNLPLPLGVNVIRKDLGEERCREVSNFIRNSIDYGLKHREDALAYAMKYARNEDVPLTDRFVSMYVNEFTQDFGNRGREAVQVLLSEAYRAGLIPNQTVEFI